MATFRIASATFVGIAAGILVAVILVWLLLAYIGWFGLGLLGLFGLFVSKQSDLYDGQTTGTVDITVRQEKAASESDSPESKARDAAELSRRWGLRYVTKTVSIALLAGGFGMFVLHQL